MTPKYLPKTPDGRLARVIEECGEVVQAVGKGLRFGMSFRWPSNGIETDARGATNAEALLGEIADLRHALDQVEPDLRAIVEAAP